MSRQEKLQFKVTLEKGHYDRYLPEVGKFIDTNNMVIRDGDTVRIDYSVYVDYFGEVNDRLEAILKLMSNGEGIVNCSHTELAYGRCLIEDILVKFRSIENKLG